MYEDLIHLFWEASQAFVSSLLKIDILVCVQRLSQEILRLQAVSADNSCRIQWLAVRRQASPYVFACLYILMAYALFFQWSYGQEVFKYTESREHLLFISWSHVTARK